MKTILKYGLLCFLCLGLIACSPKEETKENETKEEVKEETTKEEKIKPNYCSSCGARLNKSANYCPECGKKIN